MSRRLISGRSRRAGGRFLAVLAALLLGGDVRADAEPMTFDGREDIGAMLAGAGQAWNLAEQDAVLLIESARFTWQPDGRLREERHRVVWLGSDFGTRTYADLRVPWDSDRQTLTVQTLRVWRGGRWVQARPTAVVETTPFAFATAPDYTGIRETLILHDGVEVPCVLECDYVIEDKAPYRVGIEGQWLFHRADPAWISRCIIEVPRNAAVKVSAPEGAVTVEDAEDRAPEGYVVHAFAMRRLEPAPFPATPAPASYLPRMAWSSFASREELGRSILTSFEDHMQPGAALRDSVATLKGASLGRTDLARRVAEFVKRSERRIAYDPSLLWARVRSADRIYDTGYGADFDLCVLAGALFREAGFESVQPVFLGQGYAAPHESPATLAEFDLRGIVVRDGESWLFYDVAHGTLESGNWHRGAMPWAPGAELWPGGPGPEASAGRPGEQPGGKPAAAQPPLSRSETALELTWDKVAKKWHAEATFAATGHLNPFGAREMGSVDTRKRLEKLAGAVVESLTVGTFNLMDFNPGRTSLRFEGGLGAGKRDAAGWLALRIAEPSGGLQASLPADCRLYLAPRGAPVQLPGPLEQTVTVRLRPGALDVVRLPEPVAISNSAGRFSLVVERSGGAITISRTTSLLKAAYPPEEWPALRALLLAEAAAGNRTVMLK